MVVKNIVVVMVVVKNIAVVIIVVKKIVVAYFLDSCNFGSRIVDFDDTPNYDNEIVEHDVNESKEDDAARLKRNYEEFWE
ncbi:hypothetical protein Tco_0636159 [Tanacetum coccineum]